MAKPWSSPDALKRDCRWFREDVPCTRHKQSGVHFLDERGQPLKQHESITPEILIIKSGAIGHVIRTTPLLSRLRQVYPKVPILWLTLTNEVVPRTVDVVLPFTAQSAPTIIIKHYS